MRALDWGQGELIPGWYRMKISFYAQQRFMRSNDLVCALKGIREDFSFS